MLICFRIKKQWVTKKKKILKAKERLVIEWQKKEEAKEKAKLTILAWKLANVLKDLLLFDTPCTIIIDI
jgi:hypothetical protein